MLTNLCLTKSQENALNTLSKEETRIFIPADKGNCIVAMDKTDYENGIAEFVYTDDYEVPDKDPMHLYVGQLYRKLLRIKRELGLAFNNEYKRILCSKDEGSSQGFTVYPKSTRKDDHPH